MEWNIDAYPDSEEEITFLEQLAAVRTYGTEELDLDRETVAMIMIQSASVLMDPTAPDITDEVDAEVCPNCGAPLKEIDSKGIGVDPVGEPCGCSLESQDVPENFVPGPS